MPINYTINIKKIANLVTGLPETGFDVGYSITGKTMNLPRKGQSFTLTGTPTAGGECKVLTVKPLGELSADNCFDDGVSKYKLSIIEKERISPFSDKIKEQRDLKWKRILQRKVVEASGLPIKRPESKPVSELPVTEKVAVIAPKAPGRSIARLRPAEYPTVKSLTE